MTFYTRQRTVQAQQYTDPTHPEWVTLVDLQRHQVPAGVAIFNDRVVGTVRVALPHDWIVIWEDGSSSVYSEMDFEYRFSSEDEVGTLKKTIDRLATKDTK